MKKPKWQIRDVVHGKIFSFESWEEMQAFILSNNRKEREELTSQIKTGGN